MPKSEKLLKKHCENLEDTKATKISEKSILELEGEHSPFDDMPFYEERYRG